MARPEDNQRVDEASEESFPASDPPSWNLGTTAVQKDDEIRSEGRSNAERRTRMEMPGVERTQREGRIAEAIEKRTSRIPSDFFLWLGFGSIVSSLGFFLARKKQESLFVGMWAPTFLLLGIYNKIVKTQGHDVYRPEVH